MINENFAFKKTTLFLQEGFVKKCIVKSPHCDVETNINRKRERY